MISLYLIFIIFVLSINFFYIEIQIIMIDRVVKTVKTILNTEGRGNVKPSQLDLIINNVIFEIFENNLFERNRLLNRENRGLAGSDLDNVAKKLLERIQHYLTEGDLTYVNGRFTFPADLRYLDTVNYFDTEIELVRNNREFKLIKNLKETSPNEDYPIGLKQGSHLKVLPITIIDNVTASYLRNPLQAKWTYTVLEGVELFNPSANDYQDIDIHPSEEDNVIIRVLQKMGINLKEKDIQEIMTREQMNEFNEKNTN